MGTRLQKSMRPLPVRLIHKGGCLDTRAAVCHGVPPLDHWAYDHISRRCIFDGLRDLPALEPLIPLVRIFCSADSECLFYDKAGHAHTVLQAEGGEQGDPLMPGLFAVGIHRALRAAHSTLRPGEGPFAFLDDTYITCPVTRVVPTFRALHSALAEYANIDLHLGKTRVWNAAGVEGLAAEVPPPPGRPPVWVGAHSLPAEQQSMVVLGTPLGADAFVDAFLRQKSEAQASLFSIIPTVRRLGCCCSCARLRVATTYSAPCRPLPRRHSPAATMRRSLVVCGSCWPTTRRRYWMPDLATKRAQLPLHFGGLGLLSAETSRIAAHWASWAGTLPTLRGRHPVVVEGLLSQAASQRRLLPCVAAALSSQSCLQRAGFVAPTWRHRAPGVYVCMRGGVPLMWVPFSWFCTVIMEYVIVGSTLGPPMLGNPELDAHRTSGEASYPQCPPSPPATLNPKSFSQDLRHCADICGLQAALTRVRQNMCQATFCAFKL